MALWDTTIGANYSQIGHLIGEIGRLSKLLIDWTLIKTNF